MKEKVKKYLWLLFLVLVPTQLGKHWWFDWSKILGQRVDYLSPTLYLVDLVFGVILVLSWESLKVFKSKKWIIPGVLVLVNILVSGNRWVAIMGWVRWGEWFLGVYLLWQNRKLWKNQMKWILPLWIIVESSLGMAQVILGGSLQGFWYWLGERRFTINTLGIAQMGIAGEGMLRSYGTFSHPNSMAGFLMVSLLWLVDLVDEYRGKRRIFWWTALWFGILGILVSGSRMIWGLSLGVLVWKIMERSQSRIKSLGLVGVILGLILMMLGVLAKNYQLGEYFSGWDKEAYSKRQELMISSVKMIRENWLGVGLNNFLVELPRYRSSNSGIFWLQPVHNIPLLWLAELGILGVLVWGVILGKLTRLFKFSLPLWVVVIGVSGLADHYWVTLPQNRWLLAVLIARWMIRRRKKGEKEVS